MIEIGSRWRMDDGCVVLVVRVENAHVLGENFHGERKWFEFGRFLGRDKVMDRVTEVLIPMVVAESKSDDAYIFPVLGERSERQRPEPTADELNEAYTISVDDDGTMRAFQNGVVRVRVTMTDAAKARVSLFSRIEERAEGLKFWPPIYYIDDTGIVTEYDYKGRTVGVWT